jgi:hypothetical protein
MNNDGIEAHMIQERKGRGELLQMLCDYSTANLDDCKLL